MKKPFTALFAVFMLSIILESGTSAGPVLDRFLNNMVLDTSNGKWNSNETKHIVPESPIGQTFITGANIVEVSRIAVGAAYWNESWTQDESLALTLWDSPSRTKQIGSAEIPYKWREWESGILMFTLDAKVQPETSYYFELTMKGGDGRFNGLFLGGSYEGGSAYEAGKPAEKNIWFEIHSRPLFDRDAAYADRFSNWNLDWQGLEKVKAAVERKDWDKAVDELIAYYESRPDLLDPQLVKVVKNPEYDLAYADLVVDMKHRDDEGNIIDLGPNWNHYRTWRTRGGVGLTRGGLRSPLAGAYQNTGDEKYAKAFNDMVFSFMDNLPNPLRSGLIKPGDKDTNPSPAAGIGGGSMGGSIGRSTRMNQLWYYYAKVAASRSFTRDVRAAMIFDMVDSANVIAVQKGGGNRAAIMSAALYEFADRHPELKKSREWFDKGMRDMFATLDEAVFADGALREPTYGYHCLTVNRFTGTLIKCEKLGLPVESKWKKKVEKTLDFILYSMQPDWKCPARGDSGLNIDGTEYLLRMAQYYGRNDFLWAGTKGREGNPPAATSAQFPIEGTFIMRSDWSDDARFLHIRNGRNGSHGHADHLSIVVYAYGNRLVVDPGVYQYGTEETRELMKTRSHATVTVDDADTHRDKGKNTWFSSGTADYFSGTNNGYQGIDSALHTRKIAFIKPGYWLMSDWVSGEGEHEVAVRFPFLPGKLTLDENTGVCHTNNKGGNLAIVPVSGSAFKAGTYTYRIPGDKTTIPAPGVKYTAKTSLPAGTTFVLFPYKGVKMPQVQAMQIAPDVYKVTTSEGVDYVCFAGVDSNDLKFQGEALILRTVNGRVTGMVVVKGTSVVFRGKELLKSEVPVNMSR